MGFQKLKEIEAYSHPFLRRDLLGALVSYPANQLDTVLLYLFISILKDRSEPGQEILYGRSHFSHAHLDHNLLQSTKNAAQHLWILFPQAFIQIETKSSKSSLLTTELHASGYL